LTALHRCLRPNLGASGSRSTRMARSSGLGGSCLPRTQRNHRLAGSPPDRPCPRSASTLRVRELEEAPHARGMGSPRHRAGRVRFGPGPLATLASRALPSLTRVRPVDQPELARSVNWLDSAGRPARRDGAGGPGPRGTAQWPVTSGVSCCLCKLDHLLSPVRAIVRQNYGHGNHQWRALPARRTTGGTCDSRTPGGGVEIMDRGALPARFPLPRATTAANPSCLGPGSWRRADSNRRPPACKAVPAGSSPADAR
jgi:hypothetical protein